MRSCFALLAVLCAGSALRAEIGSPLYDDRVYGPTARTYEGVGARGGEDAAAMHRTLEQLEATRDALAEAARENALLRREVEEARSEIDRIRFAPPPAPSPAGAATGSWGVLGGAPEERSYTVKRGDTLGGIAQRELGSRARWPEIHRMNREQVRDANVISPGQVLRLPPSSR